MKANLYFPSVQPCIYQQQQQQQQQQKNSLVEKFKRQFNITTDYVNLLGKS